MFYDKQSNENKEIYKRFLNAAAILGRYNSPKSKIPQINTRISEEIFCRAFNAKDLGRKDISIDAHKPNDGLGIKTFQGGSLQKIAEFNDSNKYKFPDENYEIAKRVSYYRNQRLSKSIQDYSLDRVIYHSIYRTKDQKILIFEQPMTLVNTDKIKLRQSSNKGIVKFSDDKSDYSFNKSKSILYQQFLLNSPLDSLDFQPNRKSDFEYYIENVVDKPESNIPIEKVVLPLFSERKKMVSRRSGLNQWRAKGRPRDFNEIYIPIPRSVHNENPGFFPERNKTFRLRANNRIKILAKVCQDNDKALMSNPNKSLGEWILRKELGLKEGELVTMDHLKKKKIDSVLIEKLDENNFKISTQFNYAHEWD